MTCDSTQLLKEYKQPSIISKDDMKMLTMFGICYAVLVHFPPP